MAKKVLFLAAGHLSSCPRLLKEAATLNALGYHISVSFMQSVHKVNALDAQVMQEYPHWNFIFFDWKSKSVSSFLLKYVSVFICKWNKCLNIFRKESNQSVWAFQNNTYALWKLIKDQNPDLIIAHHPICLFLANKLAKRSAAKYVYDIEDASPFIEEGRYIDNPDRMILRIEKKFLPEASLISSASPLFSDLYKTLYPNIADPIRVLNVFDRIPDKGIKFHDRMNLNKISFYWYSQTVGLNRGLQDLFLVIDYLPENSFEVHIRGYCQLNVKSKLLKLIKNKAHHSAVFFHEQVAVHELAQRNREHDIGFALELSSSLNKDYCISNKILDYIRSGLMIVATKTKGQQYILKDFGEDAIVYQAGDIESLADQLLKVIHNSDRLKLAKEKSKQLAIEKYNWEKESELWIQQVQVLLN